MKKQIEDKKIALIGGHLTPAIAVLNEFEKRGYKNIIWIGTKYAQTHNKNVSLEYQIITQTNARFVTLKTGKLWRKVTFKTLKPAIVNFFLIPYGFFKSLQLLIKHRPDIIVSFGGHLALPVVISGKILGIKSVTHEQTVVTGLTNKIISVFANKVFVSWKSSLKYFPKSKTIFSGLPVRDELTPIPNKDRLFNNDLPTLLVMGGNQGSNTINWRLLKILPDLLKRINIIHLTGNSTLTNDFQKSLKEKENLTSDLKDRYLVAENAYFETYAKYLNSSDIVLSRSGANAVSELLLHGKLCVLVPIPWASQNEQLLNAQMLENVGLGIIIKQYDQLPPEKIKDSILKLIDLLKLNKDLKGRDIKVAKNEAQQLLKHNSVQTIVDEIEVLI